MKMSGENEVTMTLGEDADSDCTIDEDGDSVTEKTQENLDRTETLKTQENLERTETLYPADVEADVEKSFNFMFGDSRHEKKELAESLQQGNDIDELPEGNVNGNLSNYPQAVSDVCGDIDKLRSLLQNQTEELDFLLQHITTTDQNSTSKQKLQKQQTGEKFPIPDSKRPVTLMGKRRYSSQAAKAMVAFEKVESEMKRMREELRLTREWLLLVPSNGDFAVHVIFIIQYAQVILGTSDLVSPGRITSPYYIARYDGVSVSDTIRRLRKKGTTWRVHGDIDLISSRLRGLNECLQMISSGKCCAKDDIVIRIATGKQPLCGPYGKLVLDLYDIEKGTKSVKSFLKILMLANASTKASFQSETTIKQIGNLTTNTSYYGCCFPHRGHHQGEVCYTGTDEEVMTKTLPFAKYMWNLPEKKLVKQFYMLGLPRVKHSVAFKVKDRFEARLISHVNIGSHPKHFEQIRQKMKSDGAGARTLKGKAMPKHKAIILHFHGGGFISMSAFAHENYTRLWAKQCKVPIISVNYSLAPQHQFPAAVNESFEAYKWCVDVAGPIWGTKKIVLVGDSAGGNLVTSLIVRCLQENFPLPLAVMPVYPVLDLRRTFSPSILLTLNDKMIPYMFLQACLSAYLGSSDMDELHRAASNVLASPHAASDEIISKFPRCHFVAAGLDPLLDDTLRFCERMNVLCPPGNVSMSIVPEMIHGFLSLNWPIVGVKEVLKLIKECGDYLNALIDEREIVQFNGGTTEDQKVTVE